MIKRIRSLLLCYGKLTAVCLRCKTGLLAENPVEIVVVRNADLLTDFTVGQVGGGQQAHGVLDAQTADILVDSAAVGVPGKLVQRGAPQAQRSADAAAGKVLGQM